MKQFKFFLAITPYLFLLFLYPLTILAASPDVTVEMTDHGFEPTEITLDISSEVVFKNTDKEAHWPASDIHPTHEIYPEFDPKRPVNPGESWVFKPTRVGTFKFHDHLFPHLRGVMTVEGQASQISTGSNSQVISFFKNLMSAISQKIQSLLGRKPTVLGAAAISQLSPENQIRYVEDMAKAQGTEKTWGFLKETYKGRGGNSGNIHDLAHLTGSLIYSEKGFNGLTICSPEFAFGCYHGFLDKAFQNSLDDLNKAEVSCGKLGTGGPFASCIHGIGHGVASFYTSTKLNESLTSCKRLESAGQQYCFDGVFMEFARSAPANFYSRANPLSPCSEVTDSQMKFACGRNQPSVLMDRFKYSFDDVIKVCLDSNSSEVKEACFDSLGFTLARSGNPDAIISGCQKISEPTFVAKCTQSAAGELIFQELPGWQDNAPKVCASLPGNYLSDCQQYLSNLIKDYGR